MVRSPSFSRSSSSQTTTIRPARISSMASSIGGERPAHRATSFSTYFATTSTSRLTGRAGRRGARASCARASRGSARRRSASSADLHDGERDAVDGDRALLHHIAQQLRRRADRHDAGEAVLARRRGPRPSPSTWPWTMWPPSRSVARSDSSRFTSRPGADLGRARSAAASRASRRRANAPRRSTSRGGQADAVDGHGVALGDLARQRGARSPAATPSPSRPPRRSCRGPGPAR